MAGWRGTDPEKWVGKVKARNLAVVRFSIEALAEAAQTPRARGGLLPVDTANLRNSFVSAVGQMPSGPSEGNLRDWNAGALVLTLANTRLGDTVFLGWTAKYARPMEARYGYMKGAAMGWRGFVDQAIQRAKAANP
jgi:hypothetical protein